MKKVGALAAAVAVLIGALARCELWNGVDQVCQDGPTPGVVGIAAAPQSWIGSAQPAAQLPGGPVVLAYLSGTGGPLTSTDSRLSVAALAPENLAVAMACPAAASSLSTGVDGGTAQGFATTPVVAGASAAGQPAPGAIAYSFAANVVDGSAASDAIRFAFLDPDGCPANDANGDTFTSIEEDDPTRVFILPQIAYVRDGVFAVGWVSRPRSELPFDDRYRMRLPQTAFPGFAPNLLSATGEPIDIDLGNHWLYSPGVTAVDRPGMETRGLFLSWYGEEATNGSVQVALLDEQLNTVEGPITLDTDTDQGDALADKMIATAYDPAQNAVFVVWSKTQEHVPVIVARRVNIWPSFAADIFFNVTQPGDGPADTPTVALLPGGNLFVAWHAGTGVTGAVFRESGERRFTNFGCENGSFSLFGGGSTSSFGPFNFVAGDRAATLSAQVTTRDPTWAIGMNALPLNDLFPSGLTL